MPLTDLNLYGDFAAAGSLRPDDRRLLASVKAQRKIKDALVGVPIPIHLHFVNLPKRLDAGAFFRFIHSADPATGEQRIGYMSAVKFARIYDVHLSLAGGALNVALIENEGQNRLPFTPWIVAHRLYHALCLAVQHRRNTNHRRLGEGVTRFLAAAAETYRGAAPGAGDRRLWPMARSGAGSSSDDEFAVLTLLAEQVFDTHVCRNHRLNNHFEATAEAFAQWCITGNISTNPLPRRLLWEAEAFETPAAEARAFDQEFRLFIAEWKQVFALELGKALHAREPLLVF
jgi:hypothetical protein